MAEIEKMDFTVKEKTGKAIQIEIDKAFAAGGGRVVLEQGVYTSGTLYLKSNVELHISAGAVLQGYADSYKYDDFKHDLMPTAPEKSRKVFITAADAENIAITGNGEINGQGPEFYDRNVPVGSFFKKPPHPRPRMVQLFNCRNVTLNGINFIDSPGWTIWMICCQNVYVSKIRVEGHQQMINNDGMDIDGCKNVVISDSFFKTGDDCLVLRAMRHLPDREYICENVTVNNCILDSPCQGIRISCPSDDIVRHCRFSNITFRGRGTAILSYHPEYYLRRNCSGYAKVEDLSFNNFDIEANGFAVYFKCEKNVNIRSIERIEFNNFRIKSHQGIVFHGNEKASFNKIKLNNISAEVAVVNPFQIEFVNNLKINNVDLEK